MVARGHFAVAPLHVVDGIPVFSRPDRYSANYERIAADHLRSLAEHGTNPWIPETLWKELETTTVRLIEKYVRPSDAILDVGVGLGRLLSYFPTMRRHGMDISLGYLAIARQQGIDVCYSRIEDMPYEREGFDAVVCTDVLEHVLDLNQCCARILSVLKPGGVLIVRVPIRENLKVYLDPALPYEFIHLRNFDEPSLQLLFERVFDCECLEMVPAGRWPTAERLRLPLPFGQKISSVVQRLDRVPSARFASSRLMRLLYNPVDLNIVVRKKRVPSASLEGNGVPTDL
jgi:2-polyprenyl-3-methyl-5-hydroxy-6-metoxy-1,4-benzoquinol methylase